MKVVSTIVCLVVGGAMAVAVAQERRAGHEKMSQDDKFVKGAMSGGQLEVKASQLALQRATKPEVKQFAQMMIDDHTRANQELMKIHGPQTIPMNPVHTAVYNELSQKQGEDFDECYMGMQVICHTEALMCFGKQAKKGEKPELKQFATKMLPTLKKHYHEARRMCDADDMLLVEKRDQ
jgi:putative membrane protein